MRDKRKGKCDEPTELKAGYLVLRVKPGEGVIVSESIEVRLSCIKKMTEAQLAIRAPKHLPIRKVK